jgi:S-DNA-T family DNA segregation ATPase FtsK/SpoIIIE
MAKAKPVGHFVQPPFIQAFPRVSLGVRLVAAVVRLVAAAVHGLWPWRRELGVVLVLNAVWRTVERFGSPWLSLAVYLGLLAGVTAWPWSRNLLWGWLRCARTRRQVLAGLAETRAANPSGKLPRIVSIRTTPVGERLVVHTRPGQSAELLDARVEELRAAARCREVRVTRDESASHRVTFDIVRTDPLAASADVTWADLALPVLSMWDPVAMGVDEYGQVVRLSLRERGILFAGEPGSGKSNQQNVIIAHAAKSPDAQLVLIDPNEVQFAPWQDRALAFATDDPGDALDALDLVRDEVRRRLALLRSLPGVVRKVTPDIAAEHGLPLLLVFIDELAFHTSVAGSPAQRNAFSTAARDVVARSRAAGIIPVFGTQRPTSDVVPTSLRDLFSVRCAFRTTTKASSDVILGEGWARQGYSATDIDINARGVGWLLAEGQQPKRFKGAWLPDDGIADLSVTTVINKPPGGGMVPAPRRAVA